MEWLEPPFHFFHPQPERPFELSVVRYEVGLATRSIATPPGAVTKPTIRFHLATPVPPGLFLAVKTGVSDETAAITAAELEARPYLDFTNKVLMQRVLAIYDEVFRVARTSVPFRNVELMESALLQKDRPLVLRLTRHGLRIDTIYDVDVVWG